MCSVCNTAAVNKQVANGCFCSQQCSAAAYAACVGACVILKNHYRNPQTKQLIAAVDIIGEDEMRSNNTGGSFGYENFGGKPNAGEVPEMTATRECIEESGLDLDVQAMVKHLSTAPLILLPCKKKNGQPAYFFTYVTHIESASTTMMAKARASRAARGVKHDCIEMDRFVQVQVKGRSVFDIKTGKQIRVCVRDYSAILESAQNFGWVVNTPSLNALGIWDGKSYKL